VARTGISMNVRDAYAEPRFDRTFDVKTGFRTRSVLCVPVVEGMEGRVSAVLQLCNKRIPGAPTAPVSASASASGSASAGAAAHPLSAAAAASTSTASIPSIAEEGKELFADPMHPPHPYFSEDDHAMLQFVGVLAGQTLHNATLYEEAIHSRRQQEALTRMIDLMSRETGVENVMAAMVDSAYQLFDVERISLYLVSAL
jgi:GAF domain-containing protein